MRNQIKTNAKAVHLELRDCLLEPIKIPKFQKNDLSHDMFKTFGIPKQMQFILKNGNIKTSANQKK